MPHFHIVQRYVLKKIHTYVHTNIHSHRTSYVNTDTGETVTTEPEQVARARMAMLTSDAELDLQWRVERDQSSGLRVFVNKLSGESTGKKPIREGFVPPSDEEVAQAIEDERIKHEVESSMTATPQCKYL
jgi:hypothetical protein